MKQNPRHKALFGFTLAEVLITLIIIGVIAAITIPSVIANSKKRETSTRIKKMYSVLNSANLKAKADGNDWEYWAESNSPNQDAEFFTKQYLLPYLNFMKTKRANDKFYVYLSDGSYMYIYNGGCMDFYFDVNGEKKPNTLGKDIFDFIYCPQVYPDNHVKGRVSPHLYTDSSREKAMTHCKKSPHMCTELLYYDGWEFKDDYPYRL